MLIFLMFSIGFLYARCETKCFGETKKSFIILWFCFLFLIRFFHYHSWSQKRLTSEFLWLFWIFFSYSFSFFNDVVWGDFVFWGIFFCVWGREVFFIIHKQIFDDFSIFLYIFFSLYRHFFFLKLYLKITHGRNLVFVFLFSFKFWPGLSRVFFVFCLVFFDNFLACFQVEFVFSFVVLQNTLISIL